MTPGNTHALELDPTAARASGEGKGRSAVTVIDSIPPPGLVLLAIVAIQVGAALATHLFPLLGATGTVAMRIIFSAVLLGLVARYRVHTFGRTFLQHWRILLAFGLSMECWSVWNPVLPRW